VLLTALSLAAIAGSTANKKHQQAFEKAFW
jgi:hypothetical protein